MWLISMFSSSLSAELKHKGGRHPELNHPSVWDYPVVSHWIMYSTLLGTLRNSKICKHMWGVTLDILDNTQEGFEKLKQVISKNISCGDPVVAQWYSTNLSGMWLQIPSFILLFKIPSAITFSVYPNEQGSRWSWQQQHRKRKKERNSFRNGILRSLQGNS